MERTLFQSRLKLALAALTGLVLASTSAHACKAPKLLNNARGAVVLCYDEKSKGYFSTDCLKKKDGKSCEIREKILSNRAHPVRLSPMELQTSENPDASACQKLHQIVRTLIDSEGNSESYCQSPKDGSIAPLFMIRWRT